MSIRALHVLSSTARRGAEVFGATLSQSLAADGWDSRVVALAPSPSASALDVPVLGSAPLTMRTLSRLRTFIAGADVVVAHGSVTLPATVLAGVGLATPVVYKNIGDPGYWANTLGRRLRTRLLLRQVDRVATLSLTAGERVATVWRVPQHKVVVTGGGRDSAIFHPATECERAAARTKLGLDSDQRVALYLGALSPEKRPDLAILAAQAVEGLTLLIAGDGPLRPEVENAAARSRADVRVLGNRSDGVDLLHASDVLLLTSESEGLPGVLMEAGLSGLPVVATKVGFTADIIEDGVTGHLVQPGDVAGMSQALQDVLKDSAVLGAQARLRCEELYDVRASMRRWSTMLSALVQR